jgi:hypothetical protein
MGEYGRQQAEARFSAARMAAEIGDVYVALLSSWGHDAVALANHGSTF